MGILLFGAGGGLGGGGYEGFELDRIKAWSLRRVAAEAHGWGLRSIQVRLTFQRWGGVGLSKVGPPCWFPFAFWSRLYISLFLLVFLLEQTIYIYIY